MKNFLVGLGTLGTIILIGIALTIACPMVLGLIMIIGPLTLAVFVLILAIAMIVVIGKGTRMVLRTKR